MEKNIYTELIKPFEPNELEWRVQQSGDANGKAWAMVLVYVDARAVQRRLDNVFGFENWTDEYRSEGDNAICRLGAFIEGKGWIYKENGASNTDIDPFKGGLSGAFKRVAASGYGIGRYLYDLDTCFAECSYDKKEGFDNQGKVKLKDGSYKKFYWKTPDITKLISPEKALNELPEEKSENETPRPVVLYMKLLLEKSNFKSDEIDSRIENFKLKTVEEQRAIYSETIKELGAK